MEGSTSAIRALAARSVVQERQESPERREQRAQGFRRALGGPRGDASAESSGADTDSADQDAGRPLDEEPGRIVDFSA